MTLMSTSPADPLKVFLDANHPRETAHPDSPHRRGSIAKTSTTTTILHPSGFRQSTRTHSSRRGSPAAPTGRRWRRSGVVGDDHLRDPRTSMPHSGATIRCWPSDSNRCTPRRLQTGFKPSQESCSAEADACGAPQSWRVPASSIAGWAQNAEATADRHEWPCQTQVT